MFLVFLFLFQADMLLSQGESLQARFDNAKKNYMDGNFERAAYQLLKLTEAYEAIHDQNEETKTTYGRTLLLLGACREKMGQPEKAEEFYQTARKFLGNDLGVPGVYLEDLSIFQKLGDKKSSKDRVIQKEVKKKKKKKFPWLLVAAGVVVVGVLVYFLLIKKSKKNKLTVNLGEGIDGSPPGGVHSFKKNTVVEYNYTLQSGYRDLVVTLDGQPVPSSGTITMNTSHTLDVSATKIGTITNVRIKFTVRFAATNLEVEHLVRVDGITRINEELNFRRYSSDDWDDAKKIYRTFYVERGTGTMEIYQEAGSYSTYYPGMAWIWGTYYVLEVTDYSYSGGADPGTPTLSENAFYLTVGPWEYEPSDEWYRIETRQVTINSPAQTSSWQKRGKPRDNPKTAFTPAR
jgi:hypothetical protein